MVETKTNLRINWSGGISGDGTLQATYLDTKIAIPEEMNGTGQGASPKELLVSSAATCYLTTLAAILENRKLPVKELTMDSEAILFNKELTILHRPSIVLQADATKKQVQSAERALEIADRACNIGNILKRGGVLIDFNGIVLPK